MSIFRKKKNDRLKCKQNLGIDYYEITSSQKLIQLLHMIFKVVYNRSGRIMRNFRTFEKSTYRIAKENIEVHQCEANGSWVIG